MRLSYKNCHLFNHKKQLQNKSNAVLVHAWIEITKYVYFVIPVGLSQAGLSQPKGCMWPTGRAMPRSGVGCRVLKSKMNYWSRKHVL